MSLSEVMLKTLIPSNFLDSDDEEIKSLTCSTDSDDLQKNQYTNYNMFNDYFGLSNLVQKVRLANNDFPYLGSDGYGGKLHRRDRFDSIDSENSSSGSCDSFTDHGLTYGEGSFQPFSTSSILHSAGKRKETALLPPSRRLGKPTTRSSAPGANRQVCVFCRNNGESEEVYASHVLKSADGKTTCPILRAYTCPICKASGDDSHTIKYCPQNQQTQGNGQLPPAVKPPTSSASALAAAAARSTRGIMPPKRR